MALSGGEKLGPYEILGLLGVGGMGEVYRARDTRLGREVALKTLRPGFGDPRRFEQEARAASALNHPNIVALYDVGENYFVQELVPGQPLRKLIKRGELSTRRTLDLAAQIADGLAAAHKAGITHRDLKPENVMVTPEGRAKILDFGLARVSGEQAADAETLTAAGAVMGTAAYMSPEQIRGEQVDHRTDIFAYGVMLHEMAAGTRPFQGETGAEVMTAILKSEPPETPEPFRQLAARCMEKDAAARFQSAADLAFALRTLPGPARSAGAPRTLPWPAAAASFAGLALGFAIWHTDKPRETQLRYIPFATESYAEENPAWSPDGKALAYTGTIDGVAQIFARRLDSAVPSQLTQVKSSCRALRWAAHDNRIYFLSETKLWSIGAVGGSPVKVLDNVTSYAIHPKGGAAIIARPTNVDGQQITHLFHGSLTGNDWKPYEKDPFPKNISVVGTIQYSPDGSQFAVSIGLGVGFGGVNPLWVLPDLPDRGSPRMVLLGANNNTPVVRGFAWMPGNRHLIVGMESPDTGPNLYRVDTRTNEMEPFAAGLEEKTFPAVAPDGKRVAFVHGGMESDLYEFDLQRPDPRPLLATSQQERQASWFPTGYQIAYATNARGASEIWTRSLTERRAQPLIPRGFEGLPAHATFAAPAISPEGDRVALEVHGDSHAVWVARIGGGQAVRIDPDSTDHHSPVWSPDGNWIAYMRFWPVRQFVKAPAGGGPVTVLGAANLSFPTTFWSPAGDWIAATSFHGIDLFSPEGKPKSTIERSGRNGIGFSSDGKTFYATLRSGAMPIFAYDVASGQSRKIADLNLPANSSAGNFSLHPDGKRVQFTLTSPRQDIALVELQK